jgi:NAD(P)-dependent dehydrogenase (short-subunit alcohol dehydrogenase family)
VAIVTGVATGIGKDIALRLAKAGASIILTDINVEAVSKVSTEIKATGDN